MRRRDFIYTTALGTLALSFTNFKESSKTHILSLSFDDGFKRSFYKIADLHENYDLKACLNVIATGHLKSFNTDPKWIPQKLLGNFDDWNTLKERGHEVMPHTWEHLNLTELTIEKAKKNIDKCLDFFETNLNGFNPSEAVYNFSYNASTTELEDYILLRTRAVRTGGWLVLKDKAMNPIPVTELAARLGCWAYGPDNCDNYVEQEVNKFLKSEGGWLILNLHGLDKEGWGPVSTNYLDNLLKRLVKVDFLEILPTGEVLKKYGKA